MKQLILHIPHSSTVIPILDGYVTSHDKIQQEIIKLTDWYTDDLFDSQEDYKIVAPFSRIFCDVERFADDELEIMSKVGMGVLYEKLDSDELLRKVSPKLREKILTDYYWKHHDSLNTKVEEQLKMDGKCLIIDCHSFPSTPLLKAINQNTNTPDFNIGTDSFHTPKKYIEASITYFENLGFSLGVDWPYSGSIVPMKYYQKDKKISSIMLEINRKLYLNEPTNEKSTDYKKTKEVVKGYINLLRSI
ncbi:MAG: N-formylglutamate amidohydrolase [Bacteroidia bacterium]|nr:N-formylglutamate amidohydrolase [Bacteroidia bacterium]